MTGGQLTMGNQQTPGPSSRGTAGLSVLIVDDSPVMRNFIRRVLRMSGT